MASICVYGDGPVAVDAASQHLHAGDDVAVLCRSADPFALLVSQFHDALLPIEFGNPGNVSLEQARELVAASFGPIDELIITRGPHEQQPPAELSAAGETFAAQLRATGGSVMLLDETTDGGQSVQRYSARLGSHEPTLISVVQPRV